MARSDRRDRIADLRCIYRRPPLVLWLTLALGLAWLLCAWLSEKLKEITHA